MGVTRSRYGMALLPALPPFRVSARFYTNTFIDRALKS